VVIGLMGATIVFSALLVYMFIPVYQLNGALVGMATAQLLVLPFYIWCVKKIQV
jgi:positive regulator of sigma E activity